MNLIPLCANHHLTDQHNPTQRIDPDKLRMFRRYKDPTILTPQFHALFRRARFLDATEGYEGPVELEVACLDLVAFVESLEMGAFYGRQLLDLLFGPGELEDLTAFQAKTHFHQNGPRSNYYVFARWDRLMEVRDEVYDLIVELLRFQNWKASE